jgi:hypothetical protein
MGRGCRISGGNREQRRELAETGGAILILRRTGMRWGDSWSLLLEVVVVAFGPHVEGGHSCTVRPGFDWPGGVALAHRSA